MEFVRFNHIQTGEEKGWRVKKNGDGSLLWYCSMVDSTGRLIPIWDHQKYERVPSEINYLLICASILKRMINCKNGVEREKKKTVSLSLSLSPSFFALDMEIRYWIGKSNLFIRCQNPSIARKVFRLQNKNHSCISDGF